jgi:cytochrome c6
MIKQFFVVIIFTVFCCLFIPFKAIAQVNSNALSGEQIFEFHCAGCHINGSNIIRRGKNLKMKALHKYGYDSVDAIVNITANGKNNMSAFSDRLSEQEIKNVAQYVFQQAENNWK